MSIVARTQDRPEDRHLGCRVWVVVDAAGNPQPRGGIEIDLGIDLLEVVASGHIAIEVIGVGTELAGIRGRHQGQQLLNDRTDQAVRDLVALEWLLAASVRIASARVVDRGAGLREIAGEHGCRRHRAELTDRGSSELSFMLAKKNNRFRMMGPPKVPPRSLLMFFGLRWPAGRKKGRAFRALSSWYS